MANDLIKAWRSFSEKNPDIAKNIRELALALVEKNDDAKVVPVSKEFNELVELVHAHPKAFALPENATDKDVWTRVLVLTYFHIMDAERST